MRLCSVFKGYLYGPMAQEVHQELFPETVVGPWMALPSEVMSWWTEVFMLQFPLTTCCSVKLL